MSQHRRRAQLPQRLLDKVKSSEYSEFFGHVLFVAGGGLTGLRCGLRRPSLHKDKAKHGHPVDVQYSLKDGILTRAEFLRGVPSIPVHIAHFDPETGKKFSTVLDCY
jgi:hypothetical protein